MTTLYEKLRYSWKPLTAITVWGLSFIATKQLLGILTPFLVINLRLLFAIPFLLLIGLAGKKSFAIKQRQALLILLLAVISVIHLGIQVTGIQYTTASNTGWIIGTAPLFIVALGRVFFKEALSRKAMAGIAVALCGLVLLISKGDFRNLSFAGGIGDLLVLASCLTWGFFTMVNRKISLDYPPMISSFYMFVFMCIITLPLNLNTASLHAVQGLPVNGWLAVAFLGIFSSGVGYVLWSQALGESGSVNTAVFLYIEPFVTIAGAWLLLGEQIPPIAILSGLIIMLGVAIVNFS